MPNSTLGSGQIFERRHICIVVNTDWFFLSHRLPLAKAARDNGARVTVIAGDSGKGHTIENHGMRFVPLPIDRSSMNPFREARTLVFLWRAYRRLKPDLVHHVTLKPVVLGSQAARMAGVPAVVNAVTGLGYAFSDEKRIVTRSLLGPLLQMAMRGSNTTLIVQNQQDRSFFVERGWIPEERVVLIRGSGVDTKVFRPTPEPPEPVVVILPARMLWDKGIGEFVAAARILRDRGHADTRFILVGGTDQGNRAAIPRDQLETWVAEGIVEWWGHRDDMPQIFAQANIVTLPSYYREGLPKTLLEGAAAARALVATDVPGCREVVRDGETGVLVPPREPEALANGLELLIMDSTLRTRLGLAARKQILASGLDLESVIDDTMATYAALIA